MIGQTSAGNSYEKRGVESGSKDDKANSGAIKGAIKEAQRKKKVTVMFTQIFCSQTVLFTLKHKNKF